MRVDFRPAEETLKKGSKTYYFASHFVNREFRDAFYAVYAWGRHLDDFVDHNEGNPKLQLALTREWKKKFLEAYKKDYSDDPTVNAFVFTMKKYKIPLHYPLELIRGSRMDIHKKEYNTFSELYRYCYRVASVIAIMLVYIVGISDLCKAKRHAAKLGIAIQLTDILRDVKEDASMGRVYFPKDELARFGLSKNDILSFRKTPRLTDFIKFQVARAHIYYAEADPINCLAMTHKEARLVTWLGFALQKEMLKVIEENGYDVYQRASLSTPRKLLIAMRVMLFGISQFPTAQISQ